MSILQTRPTNSTTLFDTKLNQITLFATKLNQITLVATKVTALQQQYIQTLQKRDAMPDDFAQLIGNGDKLVAELDAVEIQTLRPESQDTVRENRKKILADLLKIRTCCTTSYQKYKLRLEEIREKKNHKSKL